MRRLLLVPLLLGVIAIAATGCGAIHSTAKTGPIQVVAAESFWGSIAAQLAGTKAHVVSLITNPAEDPHSYEPKAGDSRLLATAQLSIVNGLGYDRWASRILAASPGGGTVLDVGHLLDLKEGDNPHRWYDPRDVQRVTGAIAAALERLDPKDAAYFRQRQRSFEGRALQPYHALISRIRARYAGTPVGASESIFALQAPSLGLRLITPQRFMDAISEGTEVSAADTLATQRQIKTHQIKVWIYNSQNATPSIQRLNALARAAEIPIVTATETLSPATANFQQWQVAQLHRLELALSRAVGR